jgi:hypothetical protein
MVSRVTFSRATEQLVHQSKGSLTIHHGSPLRSYRPRAERIAPSDRCGARRRQIEECR